MSVFGTKSEPIRKHFTLVLHAIQNHFSTLQSEREIQRQLLERLWVLAQRYSIITKGLPAKFISPPVASHLPDVASHLPDDEIKTDFFTNLSKLQNSNSTLNRSLSTISDALFELTRLMKMNTIDTQEVTSMEQPLSFYLEMLMDIQKYFKQMQSKLNCYTILLTPDIIKSIERYKKLLEVNIDFNEYYQQSMAYCTRLQMSEKTKT